MTTRRPALTTSGKLLTALLIFTAYTAAQTSPPRLTTLHEFAGHPNDGGNPGYGAMVIGKGGVLYGTTVAGGTSDKGTVFSVTPPASPGGAWTETVLYSFTGYPSDGWNPGARVVIGTGGVLYGTTFGGGTSNAGTVFSLTPPASPGGAWTEAVLYSFTGGSDGSNPIAGVVIGKGGVLYGTTMFAGGPSASGTVFSLTPPASPGGVWTQAVLHSFTGYPSDGRAPHAGVAIGKGGVLYGTTPYGGTHDQGTVFSLTPPASPGGVWTEAVLYSFGINNGDSPWTGVVAIGKGGVLYGTTYTGGTLSVGTVFSLTPPASPGGAWTFSMLYSFTGPPSDGMVPYAGVVIGTGGVLYGTTINGGTGNCTGFGQAGCGTAFSLTPPASPGGVWTEAVLYSFTGGSDGYEPPSGVVIGRGGVLYGTTSSGGTVFGTVFKLVQPNPVPSLASLSPSSATHGGLNFTLTITGSNFVLGCVAQWKGANRSTTFVNSGQVTAKILASDIANPGTATVTVKNPAPGGGTSNSLTFTID